MKKFLVVIVASCFSFGLIRPAYGNWFIDFFSFFSSSENEQCIKAKESFTNASFEFVNGLEEERLLSEEKQDNSTMLSEIRKQNTRLEKKLNVSKRAMLSLCDVDKDKSVANKNIQNTDIASTIRNGNEL
jgi:cell shape-determining protein MreC